VIDTALKVAGELTQRVQTEVSRLENEACDMDFKVRNVRLKCVVPKNIGVGLPDRYGNADKEFSQARIRCRIDKKPDGTVSL
jgi:hypothetical protein